MLENLQSFLFQYLHYCTEFKVNNRSPQWSKKDISGAWQLLNFSRFESLSTDVERKLLRSTQALTIRLKVGPSGEVSMKI